MSISIIMVVAAAQNDVIGFEGDMPWQLSTDLKRFKAITLGKPMIMGRKTFEAIGKPLPGRTSIVITRNRDWQSEGVVPAQSLDQAVALATEIAQATEVEEICIVGGGEIFRQGMELAETLHYTRVHAEPEGDTVFPKVDPALWQEISREDVPVGEKDTAATTYIVYKKRN